MTLPQNITPDLVIEDATNSLFLREHMASAEEDGFKIDFAMSGLTMVISARHEDGRYIQTKLSLKGLMSDAAKVTMDAAQPVPDRKDVES